MSASVEKLWQRGSRYLGQGQLAPARAVLESMFGRIAARPLLAFPVVVAIAIVIPRGHSRVATIIAPVILCSGHTSHERCDGQREHDE